MKNISKFVLCSLITLTVYFALQLPYINILQIFFTGFVPLTFLISFLMLFRPSKKKILMSALLMLFFNLFFILFRNQEIAEHIAVLSYFLIFLYIVLSLPVLKSKK